MSSLKQNIRSVLADVETFLVETLKSVKLNSSAKDHKDRLLEKIRQLLDEIPGSASSQPDSNASNGSLKISGGGDSGSGGTSNNNLQTLGDEDSGYADNIPKVAASDLKNKLQTGMLDKKKKSGFKTWEPLYCVISSNIFYMYKKQGDSKQKEAFCLNGYEFQEAPGLEKDTSRKDMCFEVTKPGCPSYQFRAGSKEGMEIWKEAITKGTQITTEEEPGEMYEDMAQENDSGGNLPAPPPEAFEDPEDIYEECGDNLEPTASPQPPPPPTFKPPPPQPERETEPPDELYDDCQSARADEKKEVEKKSEPPVLPPGRRREPPPVPASAEPPLPPPPKADLPAVPKTLPPLPDRKGGSSEPPPLPSNPPPLPGRGGSSGGARVPQLRKPFMDRDEDFENIYYGKWDCTVDSTKELAFKQGDLIHVLSQDFDAESWWVGELDGKVGLVPKEYLCPAFELVP